MLPPSLNVVEGHPIRWVEVSNIEPIFDHAPKANREAASEKEMPSRLIFTAAKGAKPAIGPPPPLKTVGRPNAVLELDDLPS